LRPGRAITVKEHPDARRPVVFMPDPKGPSPRSTGGDPAGASRRAVRHASLMEAAPKGSKTRLVDPRGWAGALELDIRAQGILEHIGAVAEAVLSQDPSCCRQLCWELVRCQTPWSSPAPSGVDPDCNIATPRRWHAPRLPDVLVGALLQSRLGRTLNNVRPRGQRQ
jgi:hypothetical protein